MMNRIATLAAISTIAAFAATSVVYAGFEWVPPGGSNKAAGSITPGPSAAEAAPLLPVMSQSLDQPLELPADAPAPAPRVAPVASGNAPAAILQPAPAQPEPLLKVKTVAPPAAPKNQKTETASEPLLLLPADEPAATAKNDDSIMWNSVPPVQKTAPVKAAPAKAAPVKEAVVAPEPKQAPAMMEMPDSAPVARKIVINPYPTKKTSAAPTATADAAPAPMQETVPASGGEFAAVDGFGTDMPLAIGLQQIAPAGYVLAFGDNVNPGVTISWEGGGKPWNDVIQQAIAPHQLTSRVEGKKIYIKHLSSANIDAIMPEAGDEAPASDKKADAAKAEDAPEQLALADSTARRTNVTDPGEAPQIQPISTPVQASEKEAEPAPTAAPAKKLIVRGIWEAKAGDSLKKTLDSWSKKANVALNWGATHDYTLASDFSLNDSFEAAVNDIVTTGMKDDKPMVSIDNAPKNGRIGTVTVGDSL